MMENTQQQLQKYLIQNTLLQQNLEKGQNHNIKVTVAKDGTVTATSAKYVVTSDKKRYKHRSKKMQAGKVIASATAKRW